MANPFKRKSADPVGDAESKVQELRQRGEALQSQHGRVTTKLQAAIKERDGAVLDDAALERAGLNVASTEAQQKGVDQAISENQLALRDAESVLAVAVDRRDRERQAAALEEKAKNAQAAFDKYLDASNELAAALEGTGVPEGDEIVAWTRRLANDFRVGRPRVFQSLDRRINSLRTDPPKRAPDPEPPPPGEWSSAKRKFSTLSSPGAIGDRAPPAYYGAFAEKT